MKRVLLTGATGYIGGHLMRRLLADGKIVHIVMRKGARLDHLKGLPIKNAIHEHDGKTASMLRLVEKAAPDTIFHLAAAAIGEHRPEDVEALVNANVLLGAQLLEAAVKAKAARFVSAGSYWQHYEGRRYSPTSLYAATKQAFEDIQQFYAETTPLKTATLTLFDVYGPNDPRGKLIGLLLEAQRGGAPVKLSPGRQAVDFVYVDDVVDAFLHAARLLESAPEEVHGRSFAVRSSSTITVREFVALCEKLTDAPIPVQWGGRPYRPREVMKPWRGPVLPGWRCAIGLEDGLRRVLDCGAEAKRG